MALPVLLRGLSPTDTWIDLKYANMSDGPASNHLIDPQVSFYIREKCYDL
jgi:hypothetical protein